MTNSNINIIYISDDNYLIYMYVSLWSLLKNSQNINYTIYILRENQNLEFEKNIQFMKSKFQFDLVYLYVDNAKYKNVPKYRDSHATYHILQLGSLLPDSVKQVYYFDCDTIVRRSVNKLFDYKLDGLVARMAPDPNSRVAAHMGIILGYNAGIVAINLDLWRAKKIEILAFEAVKKYSKVLKYHDQDVLNLVLKNQIGELPVEFNAIYTAKFEHFSGNPIIVHYAGDRKPWRFSSRFSPIKYGNEYWKILKLTPYKNHMETEESISAFIKKFRVYYINNSYYYTKYILPLRTSTRHIRYKLKKYFTGN